MKAASSCDWLMGWLLPIGYAAALCAMAPLRTAFQFGGDEGYELIKALLVSKGYHLYNPIWNDQPALHTLLLAGLFRLFGPSALAGRLLSVGFAALLIGAFYRLVAMRAGSAAGIVAALLLIASPPFILLSVSVMIELPAMALGVASVWALFHAFEDGLSKKWSAFSGILFGCALEVKLTAAIFLPAIFLELARLTFRQSGLDARPGKVEARIGSLARWAGIWCAAVMGVFVILAPAYSWNAPAIFWRSHFSKEMLAHLGSRYGLEPLTILAEYEFSIPALAGLVLILWKRRGDLSFPAALLATVWAVHLRHRPYWFYYQMHFAIPMAWLGGIAAQEGWALIWTMKLDGWKAMARAAALVVLWSGLISLILVGPCGDIGDGFESIKAVVMTADQPAWRALQKHARGARWVLADPLTAFQAGLLIPPELAVMPSKRIWSGQISAEQIADVLERRRPELILPVGRLFDQELVKNELRRHYRPERDAATGVLFYLRRNQDGAGGLSKTH